MLMMIRATYEMPTALWAYPTNFYNDYQVAPVKAAMCCRVRTVIGFEDWSVPVFTFGSSSSYMPVSSKGN